MKAKVTSRVTVNAPPNEVFKYLQDLRLHPLWNPQIQSITPLVNLEKGTVYRASRLVLGQKLRVKNTVVELVPDRCLRLENKTGMVKYLVDYRLQPRAAKTQVIFNIEVANDSPAFNFAAPVLKSLARRELQSDLQALKLAVEHQLT